VAGTGSFAAEISDWARAAGIEVLGLVEMEDQRRVGQRRHGLEVVAAADPPVGAVAVLGLGGDRRGSWAVLSEHGWKALTLVHPAASLASDVRVGAGATVGPMAVVGAASEIGEQAIVSRGALVGHHVSVGAYATLNPGVNVGGNATIGEDAFVGMGAVVANGITVGERALVAAGAVVVRDVEPGARVQGVPARQVTTAAR
jgi:sugar O-acyltransferase (sialic acid O-acetyltransferase NeuD family)